MKKYMLFTADNFEVEYSVFQGDYDSLGEAFRSATALAHDEGTLCVYRIVTWKPHAQVRSMPQVFGAKVQRCVAEGFVNGEFAIDDCRLKIGKKESEKNLTLVRSPG